MADRDQFGPQLRLERERRGVTLHQIAASTKVSVDLWEGMERNDFSRWPSGIFARAFVRDYARAVGLDPDAVVDEFCRLFPLGDRRAARIVQAQAELIGHPVEEPGHAEPLPAGRDRRRARASTEPHPPAVVYRPRVLAAAADATLVLVFTGVSATLIGAPFWSAAGVCALLYFSGATILTGASPGARLLDLLRHRAPSLFTASRRAASV
ncbi:MAG TPA: helix-turn-helix domain-containing protein [Vicinamibacterales bacterium]|nr:helix-turn-helix domain-containing protein [Vicinamibacterales bacterium]